MEGDGQVIDRYTIYYKRRPIGEAKPRADGKGWMWKADRGGRAWTGAASFEEAEAAVIKLHLQRGQGIKRASVTSVPMGGKPAWRRK